MIEDSELLRQYREDDAQEAFSEIVKRYVDLVYSVAFRQLGEDEHLASDVCQEVFLILAQKAKSLSKDVVIAGWLYRSALYAAKATRRREVRRRAREALVMIENESGDDVEADWARLRPALDRAIGRLSEKDRDAICLRFFHQRSFSEVGEHLGLSENAARMRVNRALEKLSAMLASQGLRSTATALAVAVGGQAGVAAPAGLSGSIAQAALASVAAGSGGSIAGAAFGIMNTTKAVIGIGSLASIVAVGVAVLQSQRLHSAQETLAAVRAFGGEVSSNDSLLVALRSQLADLDSELAQLNLPVEKPASLHGFSEEEFENELEQWAVRVGRMAEYLGLHQSLWIPEIEFLTAKDWLDVAKEVTLENEADYRKALAQVRAAAKHKSVVKIKEALMAYLKSSGGAWPAFPEQLTAYGDPDVNQAILGRFRITTAEEVGRFAGDGGETVLVELEQADPLWESQFWVSANGAYGSRHQSSDTEKNVVSTAKARFETEHGRAPVAISELAPYLEAGADPETFEDLFNAITTRPQLPSDEEQE